MASTVEVARKRRHLELLQKVQANRPLSAGELRELQEYEQQTVSSEPAAAQPKPIRIVWHRRDRRRKRDRPPVPAATMKQLGFECASMPHAEVRINCERSLVEVLAEWPVLEVAWDQGQMLRNLEQFAGAIMTVTEAAKLLGFERGQDLRQLLDTDVEVRNVWEQARLATMAESKQALVQSAKDGNHAAIKAVAMFHREEAQSPTSSGPVRLESVTITQLAEILGVARQTVHEWFHKQGLPRNTDGNFDLATAITWWQQFTIKKAGPGRGTDTVADQLQRQTLAKRELELSKQKKEVLPRVPVIQRYTLLMTTVVQEMNRQVRDLGPLLVNKPLTVINVQLEKFRAEMLQRLRNAPDEFLLEPDAQAAYEAFFGVLFKSGAKDAGNGSTTD